MANAPTTAGIKPRHIGGKFQKGHPRFGGRKKQEKVPHSHRDAMNAAAKVIGTELAQGKKGKKIDDLVALYVHLGRQKFELFMQQLIHVNVPKATGSEASTNNNTSSGPTTLQIVSIPSGQHFDRETGELLDGNGNFTGLRWDRDLQQLIVPEGLPLDVKDYKPATDNVVELSVVRTPEPDVVSTSVLDVPDDDDAA